MNMYAKFQLHPPYGFWGEDFWIFFSKIYPLCCHGKQSNSAIWTKCIRIVEDYSRNISVKKNLNTCSETAKIANFHVSHYKSMETISFHSNQSSYPTGTKKKTQLFVPPAYRCYIWNLVRIGFMDSDEMSFENVDGRRTTDACLYYKLTYEPSAQVSWKRIRTYIKPVKIRLLETEGEKYWYIFYN